MKDTTAKIDPGTRDKLAAMAEVAGMTAKDFIAHLVASYDANQARESVAETKEMSALCHHLSRIEEIYISMAKSSKDRQEADAIRISQAEDGAIQAKAAALEAKAEAEQIVQDARAEIEKIKGEAALARENAQKEIQEAREESERAREAQEQAARLAVLADKAAAAAEQRVAQLESLADQAEEYRLEATRYRQERDELGRELGRKLKQAEEDMYRVKEEAKAALDAQIAKNEDALQRALERADVEKEKALLAARGEYMDEIGKLREAIATLREEKAELEVKISRTKSKDNSREDDLRGDDNRKK